MKNFQFPEIQLQICDDKNKLNAEIDNLVKINKSCLIYYSKQYRDFLKDILNKGIPLNFCISKNGKIIGFIPNFLCESAGIKISNSLPFYGSNGGLFLNETLLSEEKRLI